MTRAMVRARVWYGEDELTTRFATKTRDHKQKKGHISAASFTTVTKTLELCAIKTQKKSKLCLSRPRMLLYEPLERSFWRAQCLFYPYRFLHLCSMFPDAPWNMPLKRPRYATDPPESGPAVELFVMQHPRPARKCHRHMYTGISCSRSRT